MVYWFTFRPPSFKVYFPQSDFAAISRNLLIWWWSPYFGHFWWWCGYDHQKTRIASKLPRTIASLGDFTSHNFQSLGASAFAYFWCKSDRRPSFRHSAELTTWIGHIASPAFQCNFWKIFWEKLLKCREKVYR